MLRHIPSAVGHPPLLRARSRPLPPDAGVAPALATRLPAVSQPSVRLLEASPTSPVVIVVADDLIWASRLSAAAQRAGAQVTPARSAEALSAALDSTPIETVVVVDLNGRAYDGVDAVSAAAASGARVLAVGQHEDLDLRRRALAAGARRVFSYNKLFTDGPAVVGSLLAGEL